MTAIASLKNELKSLQEDECLTLGDVLQKMFNADSEEQGLFCFSVNDDDQLSCWADCVGCDADEMYEIAETNLYTDVSLTVKGKTRKVNGLNCEVSFDEYKIPFIWYA